MTEELGDLAGDYKMDLRTIGGDFGKEVETRPENLNFGPVYKVTTRSGAIFEIISYVFDEAPSKGTQIQYFIVAVDQQEKVIGHESMTIHDPISFSEEDHFESDAYIATGMRGKGLATALELVCCDILERECTRLGKKITSLIYENLIEQDLERLRKQDPSSEKGLLDFTLFN